MKTKNFPIFLTIVFSIIFFVFYKGLQKSNIYIPKIYIEKDIPLFEAKLFESDKKVYSKEIFKSNKFYLMNIWASWCVPCREEHPFLINLSNQNNIEIIGLNYKDNNRNAKRFLNELGNPYNTILLDEDGTIAIEWGAYGVPETFLIYDNKIVEKIIGPISESSFLKIKKLIE